ncbi:MAG: glycosyltransferase, partial [Deltaproteobacteria bacterium]
IRRAAAITVNSCSADDKCLGFGASAERVRLVRYPGVDRERFRPMARDEARRALGISAGKVILCPRGLGGYLNSDVIVEAAAGVAREWPDALFLFVSGVGGEAERENHRQMARSLGIEKNCRFDGQVPWEAMPTYYGASDAMVSISSNDSLPNCMMEAMACGVPVILGDISQLREWIDDGINGFLVPPREPSTLAERILRILRDVDGSVAGFSSRNLDLVAREFDSASNGREVKDLVRRVAGRAP